MTASGQIALARENLRTTLVACPAVLSFLGVENAVEAHKRIYNNGLPEPEADGRTRKEWEDLRPFVIVSTHHQAGLRLTADAVGNYTAGGVLVAQFERNAPTVYDDAPTSAANEDWENVVGAISTEIMDRGTQPEAGELLAEVLQLQGMGWGPPEDAPTSGVYQGAELAIRY